MAVDFGSGCSHSLRGIASCADMIPMTRRDSPRNGSEISRNKKYANTAIENQREESVDLQDDQKVECSLDNSPEYLERMFRQDVPNCCRGRGLLLRLGVGVWGSMRGRAPRAAKHVRIAGEARANDELYFRCSECR
jgi:hypothetical protein